MGKKKRMLYVATWVPGSSGGGTEMRAANHIKALLLRTELPEVFRAECFALIDIGFVLGLLGMAGR